MLHEVETKILAELEDFRTKAKEWNSAELAVERIEGKEYRLEMDDPMETFAFLETPILQPSDQIRLVISYRVALEQAKKWARRAKRDMNASERRLQRMVDALEEVPRGTK